MLWRSDVPRKYSLSSTKENFAACYLVCVLDQNRGCPAAVINSVYERHPEMKTTDATTRVDNLPGEFKEWDGSKQR